MGKRVLVFLFTLALIASVCGAGSTERQSAWSGAVSGFSSMASGTQAALFSGLQDNVSRHDSTVLFYAGSALSALFEDVEVVGNYAYCAAYYGLVILDISDPYDPRLVSELYIEQGDGSACHMINGAPDRYITVAGDYAYMTLACSGLRIIDVSNPLHPTLVGSYLYESEPYPLDNQYSDVLIHGDYAYVAFGNSGMVISAINISDPSNPTMDEIVGCGCTQVAQMALRDHYIYAADLEYVAIIDIADPASPINIGTITLPYSGINAIAISGNYAYVGSRGYDGVDGMVVLDVTDPESPTAIDSLQFPYGVTSMSIVGHYAYCQDNRGLTIVDIANPTDIAVVASRPYNGRNIAVVGTHAIIVGWGDVHTIDVSDPANPSVMGVYEPGQSLAVEVKGDDGYVLTTDGLWIVDIADRTSPVPAGFYSLSRNAGSGHGKLLATGDNYAYVCSPDSDVLVIDAHNPAAPYVAATINVGGKPRAITQSGNYLFVAASEAGLVVVDISNSAAPQVSGSFNTAGSAQVVVVRDDLAYVADGENAGLVILDISEPASPDSIGGYMGEGFQGCHDVAAYNHYAYIIYDDHDWARHTGILDISDPASPISVAGSFECGNIVGAGDYLFVMGGAGLFGSCGNMAQMGVYRLGDPLSSLAPAVWIGPGFPFDMAMQEDYVYMVDDAGLQVIHMPGAHTDPGLFSDDFSGGPEAAWNQIEGSCTWTATGTTWQTSAAGQQIYCTQTVGDAAWHNYEYQAEVNGHAGVDKVINFRLQDSFHWYGLNLRSSTGELLLTKRTDDGMPTVLATAPYPNSINTWYWVRIRCIDETFHIYINDTEVLTYADTADVYYAGGIGITCYTGAYGSCDIEFDNVYVVGLPDHSPGDANGDGKITVGDAVFLVSYIFREGEAPESEQVSDSNCDGKITVGDAIYLVSYIFRGGPAPGCP